MTEPGFDCSMAIWNASRSDMRACARSMSTLTELRSVSWSLSAKCLIGRDDVIGLDAA